MRRREWCLVALLLAILATSLAATNRAPNIVIIANPGIPVQEISREDLKSVFLCTKIALKGGGHVQPVIEKGGPTHLAFLRSYLGKTDSALQTYYRSLVFSGQGLMPTTLSSDEEMVTFVGKTQGAIGYVESSVVKDGVKTLQVK